MLLAVVRLGALEHLKRDRQSRQCCPLESDQAGFIVKEVGRRRSRLILLKGVFYLLQVGVGLSQNVVQLLPNIRDLEKGVSWLLSTAPRQCVRWRRRDGLRFGQGGSPKSGPAPA